MDVLIFASIMIDKILLTFVNCFLFMLCLNVVNYYVKRIKMTLYINLKTYQPLLKNKPEFV